MYKVSGDSNHFMVVRKVWVVGSVMVSESGSEGGLVSSVSSDESSIARVCMVFSGEVDGMSSSAWLLDWVRPAKWLLESGGLLELGGLLESGGLLSQVGF